MFRSASDLADDFAPEDRGQAVHVFHIEIQPERISARDQPVLGCRRQMKPSPIVRQYPLACEFLGGASFDASKSQAAVKAFRDVEIVAG